MVMDSQYAQGQTEEELNDAPTITPLEIVTFVWRSARKHRWLAGCVGTGVIALGASISTAVPLWYESEARILVEDSAAKTTALLGGHGHDSRGPDPVRESSELIRQKSKLESLVIDSHLLANWELIRPLPLRIKDRVLSFLFGPMSKKDKITVLTDMLEDRISIGSDKGIVTVATQWRDPKIAQQLATLTKDMLIESLQTQEFSSINTAISLLDDQTKHAAELIPAAREAVVRARKGDTNTSKNIGASSKTVPETTAAAPTAAVATAARKAKVEVATGAETQAERVGPSDAEIEEARQNNKKLLERLTEIRAKITGIEVPWQRRLAELKLQLSDMQVTYGPEHPSVIQQQARIDAASAPPAELQDLRSEEQDLLGKARGGELDVSAVGQRNRVTRVVRQIGNYGISSAPSNLVDSSEKDEDPAVIAALAGLQSAIAKYGEVAGRADMARFELTIAQVAFQHQYVVVREPELPKAPKKPLRKMVLLGSIGVGLGLALLIGAIRDLISGRVFAPWQVKVAGIHTLGELRIPENTG